MRAAVTCSVLGARAARDEQSPFAVAEGIDRGDLAQAGWGVIFPAVHPGAPEERALTAIREAMDPLLRRRRQQATIADERYYQDVHGYRGFRPGDTPHTFLGRHGVDPGAPADPEAMPDYLLIVGSPDGERVFRADEAARVIVGSCGISRPFAPDSLRKYLADGDDTRLRRRLEAEAKALFALHEYGRLHHGVRLRWGFLDERLPAPWVHPDEPGLPDMKRQALARGVPLELVVGGAPGWAEPWSRAVLAHVRQGRESWDLFLTSGQESCTCQNVSCQDYGSGPCQPTVGMFCQGTNGSCTSSRCGAGRGPSTITAAL